MLWTDAPAKINLALHITGRRPDGYHLIESLVVFAGFGDRIAVQPTDEDAFQLEGPEAAALSAETASNNLVIRARDGLRDVARHSGVELPPVTIILDKRLPVASGIGGGSADAAETLKVLCSLWNYDPGSDILAKLALDLGADVPMCLDGRALIARGIGEKLAPIELGFDLDLVIINPRVGVSTPAVFSALEHRENTPLPAPDGLNDKDRFLEWLRSVRNDLQQPAERMVPAIGDCLSALEHSGACLARMSGSGASCFGVFASTEAAQTAAASLRNQNPGWFIAATQSLR